MSAESVLLQFFQTLCVYFKSSYFVSFDLNHVCICRVTNFSYSLGAIKKITCH